MPARLQLLQDFEAALEAGGIRAPELHDRITDAEPADVAYCLQELESHEAVTILNPLAPEVVGKVLAEMTDEYLPELIAEMSVARLQRIVDSLPPDDAADIYNHLPQAHRFGILEAVDKDLASQIRRLAEYEAETAGSIMTPQLLAVNDSQTTEHVLEDVKLAEKVETDQIYVVDDDGRLEGVLSLQDLLHEVNPERPIREVMEDQVISVHEDADQEEVVRIASTYGLSTVPVVDDHGQLVGIVTADDIDYVQGEEASEDIFRMAGTTAVHPTKLPVIRRIWNRLPTILLTVLIGLLTAQILGVLSGEDGSGGGDNDMFVIAMRYVLIVIAVAGNVGTISNTIVVRGLATAELERGRLTQPFFGELWVGAGIGVICAIVTFLGVAFIEDSWLPLSFVIATGVLIAVIFSAIAGFVIPIGCSNVGIDPALAGPLVIALNDLAGTAVYVLTCHLIIPLWQ